MMSSLRLSWPVLLRCRDRFQRQFICGGFDEAVFCVDVLGHIGCQVVQKQFGIALVAAGLKGTDGVVDLARLVERGRDSNALDTAVFCLGVGYLGCPDDADIGFALFNALRCFAGGGVG